MERLNNMNDFISVIIPIYKVEEYLDECISSIVNQTFSNLEIILVDDGSPDKCPEMCDNWAKKDSRIKVIHKSNRGLSDARNAGLEVASGKYISFVDSDDWIDTHMYEILYKHIKEENADICACGIMACYPNHKQPLNTKCVVGHPEEILSMLYDNTAYPVSAWNKLYKREMWQDFYFPVGKICEDAFTTYLLIDKADKIVQISEPLYNYRIRSNSIMTSEFSKKKMDEEEAWRVNYEYMKEKYPSIKKKSFDFYLQKVNILIHTIPLEKRKDFVDEYNYLYKILKKNLFYILFMSNLNIKSRIKILLDFIKL